MLAGRCRTEVYATDSQPLAESAALGTSVDHLYRRGAVYWWQRRLPVRLAVDGSRRVAHSLLTADPLLARRLARACSAAFDHAILDLMSKASPTREDLVGVLDDIFRRVLQDGERTRADRAPGPPEWLPEPATDPRYEGLEPEQWNDVDYPPEEWIAEWRSAVLTNTVKDVLPMVADALRARNLDQALDTPAGRHLCRLSLIVAAHAHSVNARREWGDYSDGWPQTAGVPAAELHGPLVPTPNVAVTKRIARAPSADSPPTSQSANDKLLSETFEPFMRSQASWSEEYRKHATETLGVFISLMGDLPVSQITGETAETFRDRMRQLPPKRGVGIYAGMTPIQALTSSERLRIAQREPGETVLWGRTNLSRQQADMYAAQLFMKTINKYLSVFTTWGAWMEAGDERSLMLHRGRCPFSGQAYSKTSIRKESSHAGRTRAVYTPEHLRVIFGSALMLDPPSLLPSNDEDGQLQQAKFWSILIGRYTGIRLGEISMLLPCDFRVDDGVHIIDLVSDANRTFKTEAGDRKIPLHPDLIALQLPSFASEAQRLNVGRLFPATKASASASQRAANISKWFTRWRRAQGIVSTRLPFHALRHTFETELKSRLPGADTVIDQIVGHKPGSVGAGYSPHIPIRTKYEAICRIDYQADISLIVAALKAQRPGAAG